MKLFLIMTIISTLSAGEIKIRDLETGRRGNQYRVWVYFDKKDSTSIVSLDQSSIKRRIKLSRSIAMCRILLVIMVKELECFT